MIPEKDLKWARRMAERYVRKGPYQLHPDQVVVRNVIEGLAKNKALYGRGYCPCRPVDEYHPAKSENTCPCRSHREDIARDGTCECGIFVSKEYAEAHERRVPSLA